MDSALRILATILGGLAIIAGFATVFGLILHNASAIIRNRRRRADIAAPFTRRKA